MKFLIAFLALGLVASGMALPSPFASAQGMFPAEGGEVFFAAARRLEKPILLMIQKAHNPASPDDVDITQIGDGY